MKRFSLVCPFYNVERYVDAFLRSLLGQTFEHDRVQIILVDDGSTDGTSAVIDRWRDEYAGRFELIRKTNAGLASARNAGLERCVGEWVLFPDPDDRLPADYLKRLDAFLLDEAARDVDVVATRRIVLDEARGVLKDTHPLRGMFAAGDRVVPLGRSTKEFALAVNSGAVRLSALAETGLRFDPQVQPTFEDALLVGQLLLARGTPLGICASATYEWTRRAVAGSITQVSWKKPERYGHVFQVGYLRLLKDAESTLGHVPDWIAEMVLYDLQWYIRVDRKESSPIRDLEASVIESLEERFVETLQMMTPQQVADFDLCPDDRILAALRSFVEPRVHSTPEIVSWNTDSVVIEYEYAGEPPDEELLAGGLLDASLVEETEVQVFGRVRLRRRRVRCTLDSGASRLILRINGIEHPLSRPTGDGYRSISSVLRRLRRLRRRCAPVRGRPSSR
jgi:glycosyltransferase involved in cell wall biosynthesis